MNDGGHAPAEFVADRSIAAALCYREAEAGMRFAGKREGCEDEQPSGP
jgi:hypothetical protein